jgi:hypothetical protein
MIPVSHVSATRLRAAPVGDGTHLPAQKLDERCAESAQGGAAMPPWFGLLFWVLLGASVVGMLILSGSDLPPASATQQADAAFSDGWTFPAGCLSW